MKRLRIIVVLLISIMLLFANFSSGKAQDNSEWVFTHWNTDKDKVLKLAKEQDRYIFLFVGLHNCSSCGRVSSIFANTENRLDAFIDENYIPWAYKLINTNMASIPNDTVKKFIYEILDKGATTLPFLFVINPDFPDSYIKWLAGNDLPTGPSAVTLLQELLTVDLLTGSALTWQKDKDKVIGLAKEQKKYILKLTGKGTSPNCQKTMKQLENEPLKQIIEDNYILWFNSDVSSEEPPRPLIGIPPGNLNLPYITIIDPGNPGNALWRAYGYQEVTELKDILQSYIVSNEIITPINHVTVLGHVIHISNQTKNEEIQVFTLTGQQIAYLRKSDYTAQIDASSFPEGVLIVCSSTGWSKKIIIR
jgi:thioredoxin-related protein